MRIGFPNQGIFNHLKPSSFLHADGGTDFTLDTTSVDFGVGLGDDETMSVMVTVADDTLVEGMENYILAVSVRSGPATVGASPTVTVDLGDNDGELV